MAYKYKPWTVQPKKKYGTRCNICAYEFCSSSSYKSHLKTRKHFVQKMIDKSEKYGIDPYSNPVLASLFRCRHISS